MSLDVLRSVASPLITSLARLAQAAEQTPAATRPPAARTGLQISDGFDDAQPATRAAQVRTSAARATQGAAARNQPRTGEAGDGNGEQGEDQAEGANGDRSAGNARRTNGADGADGADGARESEESQAPESNEASPSGADEGLSADDGVDPGDMGADFEADV